MNGRTSAQPPGADADGDEDTETAEQATPADPPERPAATDPVAPSDDASGSESEEEYVDL